jgi:hypothetical protein
MLCAIIDTSNAKWATVIDGKLLGTSKHKDYSPFHWKARDLQALKAVRITKFVFIDANGAVEEVILAEDLKLRGQNFKTAKRDKTELSASERDEIARAVEIARKGNVESPMKALSQATPAAEQPKAMLSAAAYAMGLPIDKVEAVGTGVADNDEQDGQGEQAEPDEASNNNDQVEQPNHDSQSAPTEQGGQTEQGAQVDGEEPAESSTDVVAPRQTPRKKARR